MPKSKDPLYKKCVKCGRNILFKSEYNDCMQCWTKEQRDALIREMEMEMKNKKQ